MNNMLSLIKIKDLTTWTECQKAIDIIEADYRNCLGGWKAWNSGRTTYLTKGAKNKIAAIERKQEKL